MGGTPKWKTIIFFSKSINAKSRVIPTTPTHQSPIVPCLMITSSFIQLLCLQCLINSNSTSAVIRESQPWEWSHACKVWLMMLTIVRSLRLTSYGNSYAFTRLQNLPCGDRSSSNSLCVWKMNTTRPISVHMLIFTSASASKAKKHNYTSVHSDQTERSDIIQSNIMKK